MNDNNDIILAEDERLSNEFSLVIIDGLKAVQDFAYMLYNEDISFIPGEHFEFGGKVAPILNRLMDECVTICKVNHVSIEEQMKY
jgi:hypothetical protein